MTADNAWLTARRAGGIGLLLWLAACGLLVALSWDIVGNLAFRDPDDALRLVQVRDWLGGQGWLDLVQRRLNPPHGVAMHWSRIVDLPIAAGLLLLTPLLGAAIATQVTLVLVPLLLLGALFLILYTLMLRLSGSRGLALLALGLLGASLPLLGQFALLRIDHHGWQILLGALAAMGLADGTRPARGAALAGLALAAWMQVSLEGLPMTIAAAALVAMRYLADGRHWPLFRGFVAGLAAGLVLLQLILRGPASFVEIWCDSLSLPYLASMIAGCGAALLVGSLLGHGTLTRRIAVLAIAGATGLAVFSLTGRACLAGPFASLDPIVRDIWYLRVQEGLPIELQQPPYQVLILAPTLLGIAGTALAAWRAPDPATRTGWLGLLWLLLCATLIASRVGRAMGMAHLLALPGTAWALAHAFRAIRAMPSPARRVLLTPLLLFFTPPGAVSLGSVKVPESRFRPTDISKCTTMAGTRGLAALPAATLFTPLDIGAHLLAYTPHSIVATGHHRNITGTTLVIRAFMAEPDAARRLIGTTPSRYVVMCPTGNEMRDFYALAPGGLASRLARNQTPDWLERVPMPRGETLLVYRIKPQLRPDGSSAPRR